MSARRQIDSSGRRTAPRLTVRVRVVHVGQSFASVGQIVSRRGRLLATARMVPYGFSGAARAAAEELARAKGWRVRGET